MPAAATDRPSSAAQLRQPPTRPPLGTWIPVTSSCTTSNLSRLGHQD